MSKTHGTEDEIIVEEGVLKPKPNGEWHEGFFAAKLRRASDDTPPPWSSPDPGTICPTCGEKTPNEHALEMRRWRAKQKR